MHELVIPMGKKSGNEKSVMIDGLLQAGDAGQYKAVARNASGESQATINLTFEDSGPGKPKIPDGIAPR
jgi:hypothetical protein